MRHAQPVAAANHARHAHAHAAAAALLHGCQLATQALVLRLQRRHRLFQLLVLPAPRGRGSEVTWVAIEQ